MKDSLSTRLRALDPASWLGLLITLSLLWGAVMALVAWPAASLVFSFAYLEWTNALALPAGRAFIALVGLCYTCKAWGWAVEMRNGP